MTHRLNLPDLLRSSLVWTAAVILFHTFMEWLFFVTKHSFLTPLGFAEKLTVLLVAPLPLLVAAGVLWCAAACLTAPWLLRRKDLPAALGSVFKILFALVPGVVLTWAVFLLIDNFTYTLFGVGAATAGSVGRKVYSALLWGLFAMAVLWLVDRFAQGVGRLAKTVAVPLAACLLGLGVTFFETGAGISRSARTTTDRDLPDVFLLSGDGLEAGHLALYGGGGEAPFLDALAAESLVFQNVFANSDRTAGSVPSVLTGKHPTTTHKLTSAHALRGRDAYEHLPAMLRQLGYVSLQLGPRVHVDARAWNMRQAFDLRNGSAIDKLPLEALADASGGRLNWELHLTEEMIGRVVRRLLHVLGIVPMERPAVANTDTAALHLGAVGALLDAQAGPVFVQAHFMATRDSSPVDAVPTFDAYLAELASALKTRRRWSRAFVVVWSDHGASHGVRQRLPLLMRLPGVATAEVDLESNVQNLDIPPTLVEALGLPVPEWMEGRSLLGPRRRAAPLFVVRADGNKPGLARAGATRGGPQSLAAVVCDRFYELSGTTGEMSSEAGPGAPCPEGSVADATQVREMLVGHLAERGYAAAW